MAPEIHLTEFGGHASSLAFDLSKAGAEIIAAAGGDGTVHDVANGILRSETECALGVIPMGTGNDFAKVVPGSRTVAQTWDTLAAAHADRYDVGHASWQGGAEFFVNGMGTGIDVEVVRQLNRLPALPGPVKYLLGLLRALASYRPIAVNAMLADERLQRTVMMMAVGNGVCQGGGFYLTPHASPQDGRLELCVVDSIPLWKVPGVLPLVMRGTHARHPAVTMRTFERIRFEAGSNAALFFQLDGELREPSGARWIDVAVMPRALRVITANKKA